MGKYKRYKNRIEKFLSSEQGQRFFNFAYSIGAAVVILGALFKILHLPGGSLLLSVGMGTEVLMFLLSAFDSPAKSYNWEEVFPVLKSKDPEDRPSFTGGGGGSVGGSVIIGGGSGNGSTGGGDSNGGNGGPIIIGGGGSGSYADGPIVINGGGGGAAGVQVTPEEARRAVGIPEGLNLSEEDTLTLTESIQRMSAAAEQLSRMAELTDATQQYLAQLSGIAEQMEQLRNATESLTAVSNTLLDSYRSITENSDNITESSQGYVEGMQSLNRNIGGLNTIYEIQLKSVSSQIDTIDRINTGLRNVRDMYEHTAADNVRYCEESEKMTQYIQQLNSVYEKMITAMTINMYRPMGSVAPETPAQPQQEDSEEK